MKTKLWLVGILSLVIIVLAGSVFPQTAERPFAREQLTVGSTPVTLTAATYGPTATSALLTIEGVIKYTLDGTTPTTEVGHRLASSEQQQLLLGMYELRSIKMICSNAVNTAIVEVTYFTKR